MLDLLIPAAHAAESAGNAASPFASILPFILIMGVFYVFLILPQQRKIKEHKKMIESVTKGSSVVTSGGILGEVKKVELDNNLVHVKIADDVVIKVKQDTLLEISNA